MRFYPGISMVTLGVEDLPRAAAFYERLGWKRSAGASNSSIVFFSLNTIVLALFGREALAKDCGLAAQGAPTGTFGGVTLAQNYGTPEDVDAAFAEALAAGARALVAPERAFWGGYHGIFADPDGHVWELAFNPFAPVGPDGSLTLPQ